MIEEYETAQRLDVDMFLEKYYPKFIFFEQTNPLLSLRLEFYFFRENETCIMLETTVHILSNEEYTLHKYFFANFYVAQDVHTYLGL